MLCSFLIPTRFRFDKLTNLVESIYQSSRQPEEFEIVARFHLDDTASLERVSELHRFAAFRYIVGPTQQGYQSLNLFTAELIEAARGEWLWHWNDDMLMDGSGWEEQLHALPKQALLQPEIHQLNTSMYLHDKAGPAPAHANEPWVADFLRSTNSPEVDTNLYLEYKRQGRPIRFLNGITVSHQWGGLEAHATA